MAKIFVIFWGKNIMPIYRKDYKYLIYDINFVRYNLNKFLRN